MHVFKYSPREGTKAAIMPNQISPEKKEERSRMLIELSHKNEAEYKQKFINKTVEVLFEQPEGDYIIGHTPNYLKVAVKGNMDLENQIKKVQILENGEEFLIGTIVE